MTAEEAINLIKDDFRCFGYPKLISTKKWRLKRLRSRYRKCQKDILNPVFAYVRIATGL